MRPAFIASVVADIRIAAGCFLFEEDEEERGSKKSTEQVCYALNSASG